MNKTIERLITIGMIAILATTFSYQVAFGTNESSYSWGYTGAVSIYQCAARAIQDPHEDCNDGQDYYPSAICWTRNEITNLTACNDGYLDGYAHWCASDEKHCAQLIRAGNVADTRLDNLICGRNVTCS
jgi:hypothetical protein